jgi:16S rRNA (guanine1516-N2)-methyltransferase
MSARAPAVSADIEIAAGPGGLTLCRRGEPGGVNLDLGDLDRRLRQGGRLAIARACAARPGLRVLDGMAGLGYDAAVLACRGSIVTACEASSLVYRVLVDGMARVQSRFGHGGRVACVHGDVVEQLATGEVWDVVYLDPMFPARRKGALPKRRAQVLANAAAPLAIAVEELLERALPRARERVVVKRRARDASVGAPDWRIAGSSVRFDVYRGSADAIGAT